MARLRHSESLAPSEHESLYRDPSLPATRRPSQTPTGTVSSPSPTPTSSSDKENHQQTRTSKSTAPSGLSTLQPDTTTRAPKRRRLDDQTTRHSSARSDEDDEHSDNQYYDPNQDAEERREVRKSLRDLNKNLHDHRTEWLDPNSTELTKALGTANKNYRNVKQTHDATIDSRFLVDAGDLTFKKTTNLVLGDGAQGVDVDEFVSKCISFMRAGDGPSSASNARSRRRRSRPEESDGEGDDQGDALNWEWLGSQACLPVNSRPPVPGFLLGPLSVQKRSRKQPVRRERQRHTNVETTRPQELKAPDLERNEKSNLTSMCTKIHQQIKSTFDAGCAAVNEALEYGIDEEEQREILNKYCVCDDGGVNFFHFAINPRSFGQTVENLFYISFLIKDGYVGIQQDGMGIPTLHATGDAENETSADTRGNNLKRRQAVFTIDYRTWRELIEVFNIRESAIPHRDEDDGTSSISVNGWYG